MQNDRWIIDINQFHFDYITTKKLFTIIEIISLFSHNNNNWIREINKLRNIIFEFENYEILKYRNKNS